MPNFIAISLRGTFPKYVKYYAFGTFLFSCPVLSCHVLVGWLYEGRSINKLQNGVIVLIFYFDDVTVTSFINIRYGSVLLFVFGGQEDVAQMQFSLRCVQCMFYESSNTCLCSCAHGRGSVVDEKEPGRRVNCFDNRCNDRSSRFSHTGCTACDGIK